MEGMLRRLYGECAVLLRKDGGFPLDLTEGPVTITVHAPAGLDLDGLRAAAAQDGMAVQTQGEDNADAAVCLVCRDPDDRAFDLSEEEIRRIRTGRAQHGRFLLALCSEIPLDLSPIMEDVQNILLLPPVGEGAWQTLTGFLSGEIVPSGRLSETWSQLPPKEEELSPGRDLTGVFRDYAFYEAADVPVLFPFGFGERLTDFAVQFVETRVYGSMARVFAMVRNIGLWPGREVLQLYVSLPEGRFRQPRKVLGSFVKTRELWPGEVAVESLDWRMEDFATFSAADHAPVLEKGDYILLLGVDSAHVRPVSTLRLKSDVMIPEGKEGMEGIGRIEKITEDDLPAAGGEHAFHHPALSSMTDWEPGKAERIDASCLPVFEIDPKLFWKRRPRYPEPSEASEAEAARMTESELLRLVEGQGVKTMDLTELELPSPAVLSRSWSREGVRELGAYRAGDARDNGNVLVQIPCAQAFSKDPCLAAGICAALVRGVQSRRHYGCAVSVLDGSDRSISPRGLRDGLLRPLFLMLREAEPAGIAVPDGKINGVSALNLTLWDHLLRGIWMYGGALLFDGRDLLSAYRCGADALLRGPGGGKVRHEDLLRGSARMLDLLAVCQAEEDEKEMLT